eukprot:2709125-Rhodomonas_salina.1
MSMDIPQRKHSSGLTPRLRQMGGSLPYALHPLPSPTQTRRARSRLDACCWALSGSVKEGLWQTWAGVAGRDAEPGVPQQGLPDGRQEAQVHPARCGARGE